MSRYLSQDLHLDEEPQYGQSVLGGLCFLNAQILPLVHNVHLSRRQIRLREGQEYNAIQ